jgi:hypothetical protein
MRTAAGTVQGISSKLRRTCRGAAGHSASYRRSTMPFAQVDFCATDSAKKLRRGFTESAVLHRNFGEAHTNLARVIASSSNRSSPVCIPAVRSHFICRTLPLDPEFVPPHLQGDRVSVMPDLFAGTSGCVRKAKGLQMPCGWNRAKPWQQALSLTPRNESFTTQ